MHGCDVAVVHHQILIAEHGASLSQHDFVVARLTYFLDSKAHSLTREELSLLDVDGLARLGSGHKEVGLATEESWDLQNVNILGSHGGFFCCVDVSHHGEFEFLPDSLQHLQGFLVADASEGVQSGTIGLAVGAFENQGYVKFLADVFQGLGDEERRALILDDTRTGQEEETVGAHAFQEVEFCSVHGGDFLQK